MTDHKWRLVALALVTAAGIAGCNGSMDAQPTGEAVREEGIDRALLGADAPAPGAQARDAMAAASLSFGTALYQALADKVDGNLVISPLSIAAAMGMVLAGAVDEAEDELAAVLLQGSDHAVPVHEGLSGLLHALQARDAQDGITMSIANRSFVQHDYEIERDYVMRLARWYGDAMATSAFREDPEASRRQINDWVSEQTRERIPELLPDGSVTALTRLVLVNAVYLLADWHRAFDPERTREQRFHPPDGSEAHVRMMHDRRRLPVVLAADHAAFELSYAGEELALTVIVPEDWNAFERALDAQRLQDIIGALEVREADIGLPHLETRTAASLVPALRALGARRVFEPGGWLRGIADDDELHVSAVQHESFLRMDEAGTEAAAATGAVVGITAVQPDPPRIIADRPYLLVLRDRDSGAVLFLGRVLDPR